MREWEPEAFTGKLGDALSKLDRARATELCEELAQQITGHTYPKAEARTHLRALRGKRYFDLVLLVAERMLRTQPEAHWIRLDMVQALLDVGQVVSAIAVLERMLDAKKKSKKLKHEIRGLLGRAYKQIYVDAEPGSEGAEDALRLSIRHYFDVYEDDSEQLWHGINAASLLFRAKRDGVSGLGKVANPTKLARRIMKTVEERESYFGLDPWGHATAAEALIGLGEYAAAAKHLERYVAHSGCDAFELGSTYRQLTEVVQLDRRSDGERVLVDVLRAGLLKRQNGAFIATAREIGERAAQTQEVERGLQKVFGDDKYVDHAWLMKGFRRATAVARVKARGRTVGTAFVLPGRLFHDKWKSHQVVLTNNHVVSGQPRLRVLRPDEVEIAFDAARTPTMLRVDTVLWESPVSDLDVTVMKLNEPVGDVEDMGIAKTMRGVESPPLPRMYIIGHPNGADLSYSLHDNHLLGINERRIHYRSPTDPGSSGSPVFDEHWDLVAIHRRGDGSVQRLDDPTSTYAANEGVPIQTIVKTIAASLT